MRGPVVLLGVAVAASGCDRASPATSSEPASSAPAAPSVPPLAVVPDASCGALECRLYDSARDAMEAVLADSPRVLAIGEAHAPKGIAGVDSSAKRFTAEILPIFKGRASDLLVELMMPPTGCDKKTAAVRKTVEPVVERQAPTNQNEYVAMGKAAKALGIHADLLRPSCLDFEPIAKAGDNAVGAMLETIARVSAAQIKALLRSPDGGDNDAMVLVYGGAFHGDPDPPPRRAAWSFAAELSPLVKGRYVDVQLFVAEYVGADETWADFPWFAHYDKRAHPDKATMFHPRPDAYVIIFPSSKAPR